MNCPYIAIIIALTLTLASCGERQPGYPARQAPAGVPGDAAQIAAGKVLFREKCATCHGKPDEGRSPRADFFQPPAPDFTAPAYRTIDPAYLFWRIEVGKTVEPYLSRGSVMPAWRGLTDAEIWQLVAYLQARAG
ncbi:MAG: c-type cytochrome [Desulfuromonadales bacterium]